MYTQQKIKKIKSKTKAVTSNRKRRINSEKHIEERDEELPWPPPTDSAIEIYNQLINSNFKLKSFDHSNFLQPDKSKSPINKLKSFNCKDKEVLTLNSVHKKLDKLLESKTKMKASAPPSVSPVSYHSLEMSKIPMKSVFYKPVQSAPPAFVPVASASSEELHTIYNNSCPPIKAGPFGAPLAPIGVFWDIENCSVPKGRSALGAVQRIRDRFFPGHYEAEFICVCDIRKESPSIVQELNDAQVTVVHVAGNSKNAADDKLRQSMRRFADIYSSGQHACSSSPFPATIVLISGDINFSSDLSDLRHRKRLYVILLHNKHAPEALLLCAHEQIDFHSMLANLPARPTYRDNNEQNSQQIPLKGGLQAMDVLVCDLPFATSKTQTQIKNRLRKLSENCGGKVVTVQGQFALVRFPNKESALRATKRMNGEDVLGSRIRVIYSSQMEFQNNNKLPPGQSANTHQQPSSLVPMRARELSMEPSWKPTWKNRNASTETVPAVFSKSLTNRSSATLKYSKSQGIPFYHSTTAASNSSSPFESSREASPKGNRKQYGPVHTSTPLNNAIRSQHQQISLDQHSEISNFNRQKKRSSDSITSTGPRLYSTPFTSNNNPQQQSELDNFDVGGSIPNIHLNLNNLHENSTAADASSSQLQLNTSGSTDSTALSYSSIRGVNTGTAGASSFTAGQLSGTLSNTMGPFRGKQFDNGLDKDKDYFDLHVTNIDSAMGDWKIIRHALITSFGEHVGVKGVWVYVSQDGTVSAVVRVSNKEEAHYAVAQLHRKKFGNKRIFISFDQGGSVDQETLKKEVASLLQDVPGASLPLFKFREMFEKRYRRSVSSSDLYRLKDVVAISENGGNGFNSCVLSGNIGRTISLSREWKSKSDKNVSLYCLDHPPKNQKSGKSRTGWAEKEAEILLPNVTIELKLLFTRVHSLLNSHDGTLPLISFLDCYESEFGKMDVSEAGTGVPLEHLLTCIQGVEVTYADNGMKRIKWHEKKDLDAGLIITQPLATQLAQFGREMVDLLKTFPRCSLAFSKLIPAYHHHFGRQCRVADYGHFNLQSLLQTLPHVIQIMGTAQNRVLTLSHRAQMKRFATDLLRVLKAHGGSKKQVKVSEFPQTFSQVFLNKQFTPEDYGLCHFADLISELVENSTLVALVKDEEGNQMLAVPKREQTPQEIHRTRIFSTEVIELFRHSIHYEMPFSKFIPAYHHHFGRQCRVSDYGFSKLAELFEAISDTVICVTPPMPSLDCNNEDKLIRLVPLEQIKVVGEQLTKLILKQRELGNSILMSQVDELFLEEHGFQLRPEMCDAVDIEDLVVNKLSSYIKMDNGILLAVDQNEIKNLIQDITTILEENTNYEMELNEFLSRFRSTHEFDLDMAYIQGPLSHVLILSAPDEQGKRILSLAPLRVFAKEITKLLEDFGGSLMISSLDAVYLQKFGQPLRPAQMGYPSLLALLQGIPDVIQVRGKHRSKRVSLVGQDFSDTSSLDESFRSQKSRYSDGNGFRDATWNNTNGFRSHSAEQNRHYGNLKVDTTGRWSEPQKQRHQQQSQQLHHNRRAPIPPPIFTPTLASPVFPPVSNGEPSVFTFDRATHAPLSPPMYDLWMRETMNPTSPPLSPPVLWTYHPIVYPPNTPPATTGNIMVPHFSYSGPWSPPITATCYDRMPGQGNSQMSNDFSFDQQTRLSQGIERLVLGQQDGRNEA